MEIKLENESLELTINSFGAELKSITGKETGTQYLWDADGNCVVKLDDKKAKSKVTRWQAIAESAAKQSKRSLIPEVKMPMSYKEAVAYAKKLDVKLVPYENEHGMAGTKAAMEQIKKGESIAVFIGPEGGFAPEEIEMVRDEMQLISLGRRILRTETAGIAALAILGYQLESQTDGRDE